MIEVRFFGRIREALGQSALQLEFRDEVANLDALAAALSAQQGPDWAAALGEENLIRAVNHSVVEGNVALADGDEVAFFPPVTGG